MPEAGAVAPRQFYPELESLRGLAALSVAGFHITQARTVIDGQSIMLSEMPSVAMAVLKTLLQGIPCVLLFFVLSGFVLTGSLLRGPAQPGRAMAWPFVIARIFRIYPAWIFTVLVFIGVYWLTGRTLDVVPTFTETAWNIPLLSVSIDGVGWSLQTELLAVPVLLVTWRWIAAGKTLRVLVIACGLAILINPMKYVVRIDDSVPRAMYLYCFVFGALTYVVLPRINSRHANAAFVLGGLLFFVGTTVFAKHTNIRDAWTTIASCLMIAGGALGLRGWLVVLRDNAFVRFLGRVSYSFYLLHPLSLMIFWHVPQTIAAALQAGYPPWLVVLTMWLISVAITLPIAALSYRFVEKPFIRIGKQVLTASRPREVVPG